MLSNSTWLRGPLLTFGGTSMTFFLMLTFYSNLVTDYDSSYGNRSVAVVINEVNGTAPTMSDTESTTYLPDEFYVIGVNGSRILRSECRKFLMVMAKRAFKHLGTCIKELRKTYPDKDEFLRRFGCANKCFMLTLGLVDSAAYLTRKSFWDFLETKIPIRYHPIAEPIAGECLDHYIPLIDPQDPYCVAYGDIFKCLQSAVDEKCRNVRLAQMQ